MLRLDRLYQGFASRYSNQMVTIDSHTQGEPTRLLVAEGLDLPGETMRLKRDVFMTRYDHLRLLLTREPRGHRDMFAAVVTEPVSAGAQFGLIYMDARRYPYLCGHGTIGAVTVLVETGALQRENGDHLITVDSPSGPLQAHTRIRDGRVESVGIDMVPSFVYKADCSLQISPDKQIAVDLVYVGGFFAMVSAAELGIDLTQTDNDELVSLGMTIIEEANRQLHVHHPEREEVSTIDVAEFYQEGADGSDGLSVVIYGEAHMDRSPCGTGTTAKMTLLHHQNKLTQGRIYYNSSPLGTVFEGEIIDRTMIGSYPGIIGRIRASAVITGYHQFVVDSHDPFPQGFLL